MELQHIEDATFRPGPIGPFLQPTVIVRQANREPVALRFTNGASANTAISLLMKQVDVISAVRGDAL